MPPVPYAFNTRLCPLESAICNMMQPATPPPMYSQPPSVFARAARAAMAQRPNLFANSTVDGIWDCLTPAAQSIWLDKEVMEQLTCPAASAPLASLPASQPQSSGPSKPTASIAGPDVTVMPNLVSQFVVLL